MTRLGSLRRAAGRLAAVAAALSFFAAPASAQTPPAYDEGFFELFVQRLPERLPLLTLVDSTGRVLVPLRVVLDHVGIPVSERADTLVLEWPPETWRTVLVGSARTIVTGTDTTRVPEAEWLELPDETYLSASALGEILDARVDVVWADLVVMVSENLQFPATVRLEQEARRERERLQATFFDPDAFAGVPYPARTGGFAAGWGLSLTDAQGFTRGTARGALGASVLGGGAEVGATAVLASGEPSDVEEVFARYTRVFTSNPWVRRVEVGSVLSEGTIARRLRGATVTNQPYTTPRYFGEAVVTPAVPAGWDYEVYQGEHLVGVSTADQPSEIRAPLNYGNTPVRIRMLGPAGQQIEEELVYAVPAGRVPAREWRYTVGGGACEDASCDNYAFGEVLRGLSPWLTAGLGADRLDAGDSAPVKPFASLGLSPAPNVNTDVRVRPGSFVRTQVEYYAGPRGTLSAGYTWTEAEGAFGPAGWTGQAGASGIVPIFGGRWMSARVLMRGADHGDVDSWQGAVSTIVRQTFLSLEAESGLQPGTLATARVFYALGTRIGALQDISLNAALGARARGLELGEIGATVRVRDAVVDARFRARRDQDAVFSIGMTLRSPIGFFQARGSRGSGTGAFFGADGGIAFDPSVGLVPLTYQSVGRAGVAGVAYYDLDGDGMRGPDEPPVTDVDVIVDGQRVRTDADGRFHAWESTPYEGVVVAIDSLSLDPEWAPVEREVLVRPSPNVFSDVTIGVHRTREISGMVSMGDAQNPRPVGGMRVEVVDGDGRVVAEERTFSDGEFYIARVRPGRYVVRVPATAAGGGSVEVTLEVPVTGEGEIVLPPLLIPRRP
ncbi:MAG: hypothetical protein AB7T31_04590 [Gemmatimonadales bacterium]